MSKFEYLFIDLDGTLIKTKSGYDFPSGIWDMEIKMDVLEALKKGQFKNIFIVSNQGGISHGFVNKYAFEAKIQYVAKCVEEYCDCPCRFIYCETTDSEDPLRKPNPGMLRALYDSHMLCELDYFKEHALMVGDRSGNDDKTPTDRMTADNFGISYLDVNEFVALSL